MESKRATTRVKEFLPSKTSFRFRSQRLQLQLHFIIIIGVVGIGLSGCPENQSSVQAQATPPPAIEYIGSWGTKGGGPGQLEDPVSIATDGVGNIFLADSGSEYIGKFDYQGSPLLSFQEPGLNHPQWVTVDSGAAIYVSDPTRASVFVFLPDGDRYRVLRTRARPSGENLLSVAVSDDGTIYALDGSTANVTQFNSRLRFAREWSVPGIPKGTDVPAGPIEVGKDGSLYVADSASGLIRRLTPGGAATGEIGPPATGGRLSGEFAVASNAILAMDTNGLTLHIFGMDGTLKSSIDLAPQLGQGARKPAAIAASPRKELLVLDNSATRILRYRIQIP